MFDLAEFLEKELLASRKQKPVLIFPEAKDQRVLLAALRLVRFANIVLLAEEKELRAYAEKECPQIPANRLNYLLTYARTVDISREIVLKAELAAEYRRISDTPDEAEAFVNTPVGFAILCTRLGYADTVVGGLTHGPRDFIRPALTFLKGKRDPFEVGIFILPDDRRDNLFPNNIAVFADVGVTIRIAPEKLANIAVGTCRMVRDLFPESVMPLIRGTVVSYSTKGSDEGPSVELQREAAHLIPEKLRKLEALNPVYKGIRLDTEVQVCYTQAQGAPALERAVEATVIIAPNLDLGNFMFHSYSANYPDCIKFSQMGGVDHKIIEFARESRWEDVLTGLKANILRLWKHGKWLETPRDYFFKRYRILAVNPGSTSTKISYYEGEKNVFTEEIRHPHDKLLAFGRMADQFGLRRAAILEEMKRRDVRLDTLDVVVARGGLLWPVKSGVYAVNDRMVEDLKAGVQGDHASNLGGLIARDIGNEFKLPSFIIDPPVVDEVNAIALITGMREMKRKVISHALSQIATAKRYAEENCVFYNELNVIVAHLGGGISVGAHFHGRYIDVNDALTGEGPFSPERSGSLPPGQLIDLCYSGRLTHEEMKLLNKGKGGLMSLLGTADFLEVENRYLAGETEVRQVVEAMAYQVAKAVAALLPAFEGQKADQILITGGLARSAPFVSLIRARLAGLGVGITVYPGQNEMQALALGALRALQGKEIVNEYAGKA